MKNPRRGFSLVEAIVAIVILSFSVPAMVVAIRETHTRRVDPVLISRARWLAGEKLEDVIADRHSSTRGYSYITNGNYPPESSIAGSPGFTRDVAIQETAADLVSAGTGYKAVTVTVGWFDGVGAPRTLAISAILTDYTP